MEKNNQAGRLADLESRITFQEDLIEHLNKQVADQSMQIAQLQQALKHFYQEYKSAQQAGDFMPANEKPPHY